MAKDLVVPEIDAVGAWSAPKVHIFFSSNVRSSWGPDRLRHWSEDGSNRWREAFSACASAERRHTATIVAF